MGFLILVTALLVIIAFAKIFRSVELSHALKTEKEYSVPASEIKTNASMLLLFFFAFMASVVVQVVAWDKYILPTSASEHGVETDTLMSVTMTLIFIVFVITQILLFYFVYKYHYRKGQKAYWYPHNDRLEIAWTVVPAFVLILLISYGLMTWGKITAPSEEKDPVEIELYAEQFKWTARYEGRDGKLGEANFSMVNGSNVLGIITPTKLKERIQENKEEIARLQKDSTKVEALIAEGYNRGSKLSDIKDQLNNWRSNMRRLMRMNKKSSEYKHGADDIVVMDTIMVPKGKEVVFRFRSKDVIHSAYLPHFRTQMNCVPGMSTTFRMTPRFTTEEMRREAKNEGKKFDHYYLMCNKICGPSHWNMKMVVICKEQAEFDNWLKSKEAFEKK